MRITVLGCGSSGGVPLIGCDCAVCALINPRNRRRRVSVLVEARGQNILIDTSPDLNEQARLNNIRKVDAVLYTHDHADHTHGIDEMRSFNYLSGHGIPIYGSQETIEVLKTRFAYVFQPKPEPIWSRPCLVANTLPSAPFHDFSVSGIPVTLFEQWHGKHKTLGYRIGNFAYSTDTNEIPDSAFEALKGVDVWLVDCLRYRESFSHSHVTKTLEWIDRLKPKQAILTHMAHDLDYDTLSRELPAGVTPGYDGMVIELPDPS